MRDPDIVMTSSKEDLKEEQTFWIGDIDMIV